MAETEFKGFPEGTLRFLRDLAKNNNKTWFDAHRESYERDYVEPARAFVTAMGARLKKLAPNLNADPRVNGSLFRINRDTRFSKDKTPYKTNLAVFFWEGDGNRMECPGFYFHLEAKSLILGTGIYLFPDTMLDRYRKAVVDPKLGAALRKAAKAVGPAFGSTGCGMPIQAYKKVPAGYDADHPNAELLKLKGLHAGTETPVPKELHSEALLDHCQARYKELAPIHRWLVSMLGL